LAIYSTLNVRGNHECWAIYSTVNVRIISVAILFCRNVRIISVGDFILQWCKNHKCWAILFCSECKNHKCLAIFILTVKVRIIIVAILFLQWMKIISVGDFIQQWCKIHKCLAILSTVNVRIKVLAIFILQWM